MNFEKDVRKSISFLTHFYLMISLHDICLQILPHFLSELGPKGIVIYQSWRKVLRTKYVCNLGRFPSDIFLSETFCFRVTKQCFCSVSNTDIGHCVNLPDVLCQHSACHTQHPVMRQCQIMRSWSCQSVQWHRELAHQTLYSLCSSCGEGG